MSTSVALALLPIAVRWASNFLQKSDTPYVEGEVRLQEFNRMVLFSTLNRRSGSKAFLEATKPAIEKADDEQAVLNPAEDYHSVSSINTLRGFDPVLTSSSSSELDLSIALHSPQDLNSLPLSALHSEECITTDTGHNRCSPNPSTTSDNESVLFCYLSDELHMDIATFDSDLERIDR